MTFMRSAFRYASATLWLAAMVMVIMAPSGSLAQEIRHVGEPNQEVRMPHGGYVCAGQLHVTPIDDTYDMVSCTGPIFASSDYAAVYQKKNYDELVRFNDNTAMVLNNDLKTAIARQFSQLPAELQQSAAIQNLRRNLLEYVDLRLPVGQVGAQPAVRSRAPRSSAPETPQP